VSGDIPNPRPQLVGFLELLASREKQLDYQRRVPFVNIKNELLCMWFDDLYVPEDQIFKRAFSDEELAALRSFNECYEEQAKALKLVPGGIEAWLENDAWARVMGKAAETLAQLRT